MKIRTGFVSNSSSSSFLLVYRPGEACSKCGLTPPDLMRKIDRSGHSDNSIEAEGREAVIAYLSRNDYQAELLKTAKQVKLKPGEDLAYVNISYHDSELNDLVYNGKHITIISRQD